MRYLPGAAVRLTTGPLRSAQLVVSDTLARLDPDRLLAPFRRAAGISTTAEPYGGWESDGLGGHTAGHVLSAAASLAAAADARAAALAATLVAGLRECQLATGSGYLGGVRDGVGLWDELAAGDVRATGFDLNGRWVPLYNLHKVLAGLVDADAAGIPGAATTLDALGTWWLQAVARIDGDVLERALDTEFGGLPAAFARLAEQRGDVRYLDLARRFTRRALRDPLAAGHDGLDGLHANTQIPVVVGYAAIERAAHVLAPGQRADVAAREGAAARTFYDSVARRRTVAIGGDSVREHFHPADDFSTMFTGREGPESCNSHNMVSLAAELHLLTDDDAYLGFAERAMRNHLLSAQHPEHGGLVYFTSQRPGHYRVTSPEADGFWCCMGSGFEAQAGSARWLFATTGDDIRINALVPATADWAGVRVEIVAVVEGAADGVDVVDVVVTPGGPDGDTAVSAVISVRIPDWVAGAATLSDATGGVRTAHPGERVVLGDAWQGSTRIRVRLPRALRLERAPDGSDWGWLVDGPSVLAARHDDPDLAYRATGTRMGHIATGPLQALADTPVLTVTTTATAERRGGGRVVVHDAAGAEVHLEPFAGIHDARYTLSWPLVRTTAAARIAELRAIDAASLALEARTRDHIVFGQQQPESDHGVVAEDDETGVTDGLHWRRTRTVLRLRVVDWSASADRVRVEWLRPDHAALHITIGGDEAVRGSAEAVDGDERLQWIELAFSAPAGRTHHEVEIRPADGTTPRLHALRLLAASDDR